MCFIKTRLGLENIFIPTEITYPIEVPVMRTLHIFQARSLIISTFQKHSRTVGKKKDFGIPTMHSTFIFLYKKPIYKKQGQN